MPVIWWQTELRDWGNGQAFRLSDALTGVCVFGTTGSGITRPEFFLRKPLDESEPCINIQTSLYVKYN